MDVRSGMLGAITALAALITAGTSLYVALREPPTAASVAPAAAIAAPARAWRDEAPERERYEAHRDDNRADRRAAFDSARYCSAR